MTHVKREDIIRHSKAQYKGEFNLLRAERGLILQALALKKHQKKAAIILGVSLGELVLKIYKHGIYKRFSKYLIYPLKE